MKYLGLLSTGIGIFALTEYLGLSALFAVSSLGAVQTAHIERELNVFWRPNSEGKKTFMPGALKEQLIWPLRYREAWNRKMLDLNYYAVFTGTIIGYTIVSNMHYIYQSK